MMCGEIMFVASSIANDEFWELIIKIRWFWSSVEGGMVKRRHLDQDGYLSDLEFGGSGGGIL
ncbi:hypothetical protein AGABI2DRAFT_193838 [Agaricus bisporus var. bisporus H97]|uniref:hypothetical protein n=1 Tax=Agaricus bisporus var. bisporus (strain H97 / ATCC MYA-4626 / FGSC 10389) TaxID=936046 RepID=UPI00029F7171|nr:hypothetical protein AGABI2DRAFT_193838 [Agaricus bisporus var. bisporus H97]EKV45913.1 hypothetical protein AGABI2DRAFT_193838 [Agaricus bisporus var. bisporus H97]